VAIGSGMNEPRDQDTGPQRHNQQRQYDHRYTDNEQEADSAIVAIRENNKQQLELQELTVSR
jgi:hypothetical protein